MRVWLVMEGMNMTGFTKGPWLANETEGSEWEVIQRDARKPTPEEPWYIALVYDTANGRSAEANARLIAAAQAERDAYLKQIGGCTDGNCIIVKPVGMHTNGGCRCSRDGMLMQRFAYAHNRFANTVRKVLQRP